jgi:hypothetical protein
MCNAGASDCNKNTAPDLDGCECATPACCGASCETTHNNGVGQHYYDCNALSTFNLNQAKAACLAYVQTIGGTAANCTDGWQCGGAGPVLVCSQNTAGTTCVSYCWGYNGALVGAVTGCSCPFTVGGSWN